VPSVAPLLTSWIHFDLEGERKRRRMAKNIFRLKEPPMKDLRRAWSTVGRERKALEGPRSGLYFFSYPTLEGKHKHHVHERPFISPMWQDRVDVHEEKRSGSKPKIQRSHPGTFYIQVKGQLPTRLESTLVKIIGNWAAQENPSV